MPWILNRLDEYANGTIQNILERYKNENLPTFFREYKPIVWDYGTQNLHDTVEPVPPNSGWYPLLYKLNKISQTYKLWAYFFTHYLKMTYGFMDGWDLDISTITDKLAERKVTDNTHYRDIVFFDKSDGRYMEFDEPQYVFAYVNDFEVELPYAWFVNGKFIIPTYRFNYHGYEYDYFPVSKIPNDAWMSVERYDGNIWSREFTIPAKSGGLEVTTDWIKKPILANSIFLTNNNTEGKYITDKSSFHIFVNDPVRQSIYTTYENESSIDPWVELDLDESIYILTNKSKIKIVPNDLSKAATVCLNCNNFGRVFNVIYEEEPDNFDAVNLNSYRQVTRTRQGIVSRLRVYDEDGRMIPKYGYTQFENNTILEDPAFTVMLSSFKDRLLMVEYMGYDEKIVYEASTIPLNGLLDLEGKIDKPFSLTYYDVFLDGYKLTPNNIDIVSPFHIIIKNVNSVNDLIIYERIKGEELFIFDKNDSSQYIADRLFRDDPKTYQDILSSLTNIVVDPDQEHMHDLIDFWGAFLLRWVLRNYIDADLEYDDDALAFFSDIFEEKGNRIFLNADNRITLNIPKVHWLELNHDKTI